MDESVELPDSSVLEVSYVSDVSDVVDVVDVVPELTAAERAYPNGAGIPRSLISAAAVYVYVMGPAVHALGISRSLSDLPGIAAVALPVPEKPEEQKVSAALLLVSFGSADVLLLLTTLADIANLPLGVTPSHIALLTNGLDATEISAAVDQGINVYISPDEALSTLHSGISAALEGVAFCSLQLQPLLNTVRRFQVSVSPPAKTGQIFQTLSAREWEVATMVSEGRSDAEAAARLFISVSTLKTHLRAIYQKLGIERRGQLHATLAHATRPPDIVLSLPQHVSLTKSSFRMRESPVHPVESYEAGGGAEMAAP